MSDSTPRAGEVRARMMRGGPGRPGKIEKARNPRRALARLLPYLKPHNRVLVLVLLLILASTILALVGPYLMGRAIDKFIAAKRAAGLAKVALWMLAVYVLGNVCDAVSAWMMARVSQNALRGLRRDLFGHLQSLSLKFFDGHTAGELMSRLTNDIDAINQAVSQNVVALVASVLSMAGIMAAMFLMNVALTAAALAVVPLMLGIASFVARYTRKGFRELQMRLGELNGIAEEAISGQRVIKAFRRHEATIDAFRKSNQDVYKAGVYANSYALLLMPLTNQMGNLFVIAIAGLGGGLAIKGLVTVGTIAAFISYGRSFVNPLRQLSNIYNAIQAALAGAERVFEIMDTPPEVQDVPGALPLDEIEGNVRFENVNFSYTPGTPIIKNMSLDARTGETVALVGPTGAGKTTIVNLLTRFYEIDGGRITIDGKDIRRIKKDDLRRELGLVLQDTFLFSTTVMENIRYGRLEATDDEVVEAARMAEADHFIRRLPDGYRTLLSERARNLSQGQRQLLAIARAILADPGILILDEATSSVDTRTEARIQKALLRLMEGRTSFVIAHRLSTIRDADQLLVVKDGEIIERGTHERLLSRRGFYYNLYMSQFKGQTI
ncbi:MAG: ABC transporter ATP-binding protein [Acidobacteriota bacterium]|nr:ABC transporter ATP-binding protein [Acidobacteriota bacterium]